MNTDTILPGVGRVWLADFGTEGPWEDSPSNWTSYRRRDWRFR